MASLREHLQHFSPAELYVLFQQAGLLSMRGKAKGFTKALATGRFPPEELDKFVDGKPSLVDTFLKDTTTTLESLESADSIVIATAEDEPIADEVDGDDEEDQPSVGMPVVKARDALRALDNALVASADEEAVAFLVASARAKLWNHAYLDRDAAVAEAEAYRGDEYAERVRTAFLDEVREAEALPIPAGYSFRPDGELALPNLMQRLCAVRVRDQMRFGNWSGTGAGKTLSAILASRVVDARLMVICCPNAVVDNWEKNLRHIFPDTAVATKTWSPKWPKGATHRALVLNYEQFQQKTSEGRLKAFLEREQVDFVVIDEVHYAKQRHADAERVSTRKRLVEAMVAQAGEEHEELRVLGLSATPVINNLQEGVSLVEMITSYRHEELDTKPTVPNCMRLHQRLVTLGTRWKPAYDAELEEVRVEVDCGDRVEAIEALGKKASPLALEQILTEVRLPVILEHIEPKTLLYTHLIGGIDKLLYDALTEAGWRVGFYTGQDKTGLAGFIDGDLDVLIGSSAVGTGVDGLQRVSNKIILNVLPWTNAEYEQLKGRVYRQGQREDKVTVVIPVTYATVRGERWSWCESKLARLRYKKSIADAAVDGVVPEGNLQTPAQALGAVMQWLDRLQRGETSEVVRERITVPLSDSDPEDVGRRTARYGDFSTMNQRWNTSKSATTHERLRDNPEEWAQYHTLYRKAREGWTVVPFEETARWLNKRRGKVVGDFGCGEALLGEAIRERHTVHSFDHVSLGDEVVACDMARVPLEDEVLDVAVFSLSLMGSNATDYLREAWRTLQLDGRLIIWSATSRFDDVGRFAKGLERLGFRRVTHQERAQFTRFEAEKGEREPEQGFVLRFREGG